MERVIVHSDINHCYAQIEEMLHPELRQVPMAVGGHEEMRHGIILAKNDLAKAAGVKTASTLREAKKVCPELLIIHPHYDDYLYYTSEVKDIYREYTDHVESFGLDEAWIDLTHSSQVFGDGISVARKIQKRVREELGLEVSMGIYYNKIFAKMGSDLKKKMGFSIITQDNYQEVLWPLPIEDLFYVGYRTAPKLKARGISKIGDLAKKEPAYLRSFLGKMGEVLWYFANGYDASEVLAVSHEQQPKSVGNGITAVMDMKNREDMKMVFTVLVESVATRLKQQGLKGDVISIAIRNTDLKYYTRQRKIEKATNIASEIMKVVMELVDENVDFHYAYRSIDVHVSHLCIDDGVEQLSLFIDEKQREKEKKLDIVMDEIREKYGFDKIKRMSVMVNEELTDFDPLRDNIIHPVGYFK